MTSLEVFQAARDRKLCISSCIILLHLKEHGTAIPTLLAQECGVSPSAITTLIDRMERLQLVVRNRDAQLDRRCYFIALKPLGESYARDLTFGLSS